MKLIILLVIIILVALFTIQNAAVVSLHFFNYTFDASLAALIIISFALGVLCGIVYLLPALLKRNIQISSLKKDLASKPSQSKSESDTSSLQPPSG